MPWRRSTMVDYGMLRRVPQGRRLHAWKSLTRW
jgi:hypothetical protein